MDSKGKKIIMWLFIELRLWNIRFNSVPYQRSSSRSAFISIPIEQNTDAADSADYRRFIYFFISGHHPGPRSSVFPLNRTQMPQIQRITADL